MSKHSVLLTSLPIGFRTWLWRYTKTMISSLYANLKLGVLAISMPSWVYVDTVSSEEKGRDFADDIFKCIFLHWCRGLNYQNISILKSVLANICSVKIYSEYV